MKTVIDAPCITDVCHDPRRQSPPPVWRIGIVGESASEVIQHEDMAQAMVGFGIKLHDFTPTIREHDKVRWELVEDEVAVIVSKIKKSGLIADLRMAVQVSPKREWFEHLKVGTRFIDAYKKLGLQVVEVDIKIRKTVLKNGKSQRVTKITGQETLVRAPRVLLIEKVYA